MAIKRTVLCPCGNDLYEKSLGDDLKTRVWACSNCFAQTPRKTRHRRTNHLRAIQAYLALRKVWEPVDTALEALVAEGKARGGAILVYSSTFNWHLRQLVDKATPSNFEVSYHTASAKADMVKAQAFIAEKSSLGTMGVAR